MIRAIIISSGCFFLFLLLHGLVFHCFDVRRRFYAMAKLFFLMLLVYTAGFFLLPEAYFQKIAAGALLLGFLNGAFLHYFIFHFYLHFIQVVDRSSCTRILVELISSPQGKLTYDQLKQGYSIDAKIDDELEDMTAMGRLENKGGSYATTVKGRRHLMIFKSFREFLRLEKN